jgi:type I restriction enzyme M protein
MVAVASVVRQIQETMRQDVGVDGDAQRISQLCWMFFLKILDDQDVELELMQEGYRPPLATPYRWSSWAADPEGMTGDDLLSFINDDLFPALKGLSAQGSNGQRRRMVKAVFENAYNYMKSGHLLRQVANRIDEIDFNNLVERQHFGDVYEQMLNDLQAAGNAGEYYTPRAVTNFMVRQVDPKLGEIVLDPACGTGGFLTSVLRHLWSQVETGDQEALAKTSLRAVEKKSLPHMLCVTNMLLHGVEDPSFVRHDNALAQPYVSLGAADRVDIVLTNPPFKGREEPGIEANYPAHLRTRDTADLFLSIILRRLRPTGRGAIVLPDSSLFGDSVKLTLRDMLLSECNLHTIVRLPHGVFSPYSDIRTNLLFFDRSGPTEGIWFYDLHCPSGDKYTKTKPIRDEDFKQVGVWWEDRHETPVAWYVQAKDLRRPALNLDVPNPHSQDYRSRYVAAEEARLGAIAGMRDLREDLAERARLNGDGAVSRLLITSLGELASSVPLTSGILEGARTALTELALRGDLTRSEPDDEPVTATLARYECAAKRLEVSVSAEEPPFEVPSDWAWKRLAAITDFDIGRTPKTGEPDKWAVPGTKGAYQWVSISDMPRRGLIMSTDRWVSEKAFSTVFGRGPVPTGRLLMGFKLSVGKTALLGIDAYHNEAIASLTTTDASLISYLLWAIPALAGYASANPAVRGNTLNSKSIAGMWIPVPPLQVQSRLVARLSEAVSALEEIAAASERVRDASDQALKLLVHDRVLSERVE